MTAVASLVESVIGVAFSLPSPISRLVAQWALMSQGVVTYAARPIVARR
ncbi:MULTISPECIES: hypothetical protein [Streptomyces]|nr:MULTISPECIES: hypothetical protein [Streptomyces]QRX89647.1 hypothetical protein JNO44_01100 [Streptomyces noursei]UJB39664.1 hypothetical protein HRD51_00995 [Streptomyces sp. A1-5]